MTDTPPRLRSFAPPTRDKLIIWSAVVAGCGIMALLGRHAAIYRFGTDEFTGNNLFAVFFILLIGLYFSIQPVFEAIFKRLFSQRTSALMVAENVQWLIDHLGNFIIFLKRLGVKHRIQHLAIAFSKPHPDTPNLVKEADITCIRLY